ncbi:uncharacterized protein LOC112562585 [Pomacea canaliculata]|uniref:uncharacterized protein LOC112562585 n=1 Tax=Pomacea canaliculata TaxID=400727 RepID=UPI000D73C8E6|nr:uncharacterized protein LOC112562585 [Pomacea canaliculata]
MTQFHPFPPFLCQDDTRPAMTKPMFTWKMSRMFTVRNVFNGMAGDLPLLLSVTSGFYRNSSGPRVNHMEKFETGEMLFAFQRAFQRRVLLHDSQDRTLSLPLLSPILFRVNGEDKATKLDDVVKTMTLPVRLSFAQKEDLLFIVDRSYRTHEYFGDLTLVSVYLEPFICCLLIGNEDGQVTNQVVSLPCRLRQLGISLVKGIQGESGRQERFRGLLKTYVETAEKFSLPEDPFFKELAFVSRKAPIMKETDIPDYIDEDTFINILIKVPRQPQDDGHVKDLQTRRDLERPQYETLWPPNRDTHMYHLPQSHFDAVKDFPTEGNLKGISSTWRTNPAVQTLRSISSSRDVIAKAHLKGSTEWNVSPPIPYRPEVAPPSKEFKSESSTKALATPPPPLPSRPVAPSSRDATPSSSKAPPLPPVSHRVPLRSARPGEASEHPQTFTKHAASSRPNPSRVPDQAMSRSARPAKGHIKHFNIERLSVDDVCRRLEDLGLEKHCKKFKKSLIDGKLLKRITRRALREDFRLSEVEIVKLSAFIDEGHIPR